MLGGCGHEAQPGPAKSPTVPAASSSGDEPVSSNPPGPAPAASNEPAGVPAHACTEMGCINGYTVSLEPTAHWPAGKYQFDFEVDGKKGSCSGSLPLPACGQNALSCTGAAPAIAESGCALPPAEHGFADLRFDGSAQKVNIKVMRNGKQLAKRDFQPAYKKVQPNGPDCEPICDNAHDTMKIF